MLRSFYDEDEDTAALRSDLKHLKLKGLQRKTIDAYARAIRRIGKRVDGDIDALR